jgi:hypothetical protein
MDLLHYPLTTLLARRLSIRYALRDSLSDKKQEFEFAAN